MKKFNIICFHTILCLYVFKVQCQTYDLYDSMIGYFPLNDPNTLNVNLAKSGVPYRLSNWKLGSITSRTISDTPSTFLGFKDNTNGNITVQPKGVTFCTWFTILPSILHINYLFLLYYPVPNLPSTTGYIGFTISPQLQIFLSIEGYFWYTGILDSYTSHICVAASKRSTMIYINSVLVWDLPYYAIELAGAKTFLFQPSKGYVYFAGVTVFSRKLCSSEIAHVYNNFNTIYSGNFNVPLSLTCPTMYSCNDNTWMCVPEPECNRCTSNYYKTHSSIEQFCTNYPDSSYVSICDQCILPGQCTSGFYMDYVCDGTQTEKNKCLTCDVSPCPLHKYRYQCTGTQNSVCGLTYTQCPTGYYLVGYGTYNDGTCQPCKTCGGGSGDVIIPCSRYDDAKCAEVCVLGSPCSLTANSVCLFDNVLSILVCLTCPLGYKAKNNLCVPCPRGTICDVSGNSQCNGMCSFPDVPSCTNSVSDGFTCTQGMCPVEQYTTDPHALYQHNYIQGRCDTQQRCVDGYYLLMKAGELTPTCTVCNNVLGAGYRPVTPGLFINDPNSCVFEMIPGTTSLNEKGYYSNDNMMCPSGYTSLPGYAGTISDCKPCPVVSNLYMIQTQTWLCEWQCIDGYVQRGDMCMSPSNIYKCYGEGYSINVFVNKCIIQPIPWQKQGFGYTNTYSFQMSNNIASGVDAEHIKYNPLEVYIENYDSLWDGTTISDIKKIYKIAVDSKPYYSLNVYNHITVNKHATIDTGTSAGLVAYYSFWGFDRLRDATSVTGPLTATGGVSYTANTPWTGTDAAVFDGSSGYITLPILYFNPTSFTICTWFKFDRTDKGAAVFDLGNGPYSDNIKLSRHADTNNLLFHGYEGENPYGGTIAVIQNGIWYHMCFCKDYQWSYYSNGVYMGSWVSPVNSLVRGKNYIGKSNDQNDAYFTGMVSEFRIYNTPLSSSQVSEIYSLRPITTGLIGYYSFWKFQTLTDGTGITGTAIKHNDVTFNEATSAAGVDSAVFGGVSGYIELPSLTLGDQDFTICVWFNYAQTANPWGHVFDFGNGASSDNIILSNYESSRSIIFYSYQGAAYSYYFVYSSINIGQWYHGCFVRGTIAWTFYNNGAQVGTLTSLLNSVTRVNNYIGKSNTPGNTYLNGAIDEFRIYNVALTNGQVANIYAMSQLSVRDNWFMTTDSKNSVGVVPGQICSLTPDIYDNYYVVFCNMSAIFHVDFRQGKNTRVIGNSTSGYQEGMRDEALFSYEMYISMYSTNSNSEINLIVIDTWNCVIRQIVLGPDGPGDFRTKSYKIAGNVVNNFPLCDNEINRPRFLFFLRSLRFTDLFAFVNYDNVVCQMHAGTRQVVCLPSITVDFTNLRSIRSSSDGLSLIIEYNDGYVYAYTHTGTKCPDDYTSLKGSDCSIYRPFKGGALNEGYYIDSEGVAHECIPAACSTGQYSSNCLRNGPASCLPCVTSTSLTIQYISSGSCDYNILSPCPMDMYFNSVVGYCVYCPGVMYTLATNGLSINDCYCPSPLSKLDNNCFNVNSVYIFSVPAETSCDVYQYWDSNTGACISCALNPTIGNTQCAVPASLTIPQWLLDRPSIRCDAGSQLVNVSNVLPVCEKCPSHLVGLDRLSCSRCTGYRKPYWDASICVCKHPTVQNVDGSCICDKGYELGVNGCVLCLNNTYSDVALTLTDQFWTQSKTCSSCPLGMYSYMGQTTCISCPQYQYRTANDVRCMNCASGYYSTNAQVSTCTACATSCSIGYYSVPCPTDPTKYICFACKPLPSNAQWLAMTAYATSYQCIWKCNSGYFRGIDQCNLCSTDYDCVPGKKIEPCSEISDLACTQDCFNDTKPAFNSVWDHGCDWKCSDGYKLLTTDYGMWIEYDCIIPDSYVPPTR